jgi:hypothetical protein
VERLPKKKIKIKNDKLFMLGLVAVIGIFALVTSIYEFYIGSLSSTYQALYPETFSKWFGFLVFGLILFSIVGPLALYYSFKD